MLNKKIMALIILLVSLLAISAVSAADNVTSDVVYVNETSRDVIKGTTDEVVFIENNCTTEVDFDLLNGKGYEIDDNTINFNVKELNTPYYDNDYYIIDYTDGKNTKEISFKWRDTYQYSYDLNLTANSNYNYTFYGHYHVVGHLHGQPWTYGLYTNSNLVLQGNFKTDDYGNIVDFVHDQHLKIVLSNYNNSCTITSISKPSIDLFNLNGVTLGLSRGKNLLMGNNIVDEYYIGNNYDKNYVKKVFNIFVHDNSNKKTFRELATKINSGKSEIVLDCDYRYNATVDSDYQSGITISSNIIINGNGHVIDGNGESKIFRIWGNVVLKNITFTNVLSSSTNNAGAIYCRGYDATIENCRFTNISVKYGVGIINSNCENLKIDGCYFESNYAKESPLIELFRNAIINNCTFINNYNTIISVTIFATNSQISNCLFINNNGTCIKGEGNEYNVINCSLINNYANNGVAFCRGNGGLYKNCSFINNSALYSGGAIFWAGDEGNVSDCTFINNTVTKFMDWRNGDGGAIFWSGNDGTLENCIFINNSASKYAGAVSWTGEYGHIDNCIFINNTPNNKISNTTIISKKQLSLNSSLKYVFYYAHLNPIYITISNMSDNLQITSPIIINMNNGIKNKNISVYVINDVVCLFDEISDLDVGDWAVNAIFRGDDNYYSCNATFIVTINPMISSLTIVSNDTNVGKETILITNICDELNSTINEGYVIFYDGETNIGELRVQGGTATLGYTPTTAGEHKITAIFNSNNYLSSNNTKKVNVKKASTTISTSNITVVYNDDQFLIVTLNDDSGNPIGGATLSININGTQTFDTDENGQVKVSTADLDSGTYVTSIIFEGNINYEKSTSFAEVIVMKADSQIIMDDLNSIIGQNLTITANVVSNNLPINGSIVTFYDAKTKIGESNVINGVATLTYTPSKEGEYTITAIYEETTNYKSSNITVTLAVSDYSNVIAANVNVVYSASSYYTIKIYGTDGKPASGASVVIKVNGKKVTTVKTNSKGIATYKPTQTPGSYKISATALGKSITKTLTVKHVVTLKTVTLKKSAKKLTLQATLAKVNGKYLKKKTITFKINGKKVASAKTNSKGVAKITIKNPSVVKKLKVGKKVTYQATYLKDTVKKTAKIKK